MIHPTTLASSDAAERGFERAIVVDDRAIPWHDVVMARVEHICRLRSGWDGYGAPPVDFAAANFALRILNAVCSGTTPAPSIVPGVDGDLQIEWHTAAWDIEVHVLAPNRVELWRAPAERQEDEELFETTIDFTILHGWLKSLTEPALADLASAAR